MARTKEAAVPTAAGRRPHRHRWVLIILGITAMLLGMGVVVFSGWQAQSMLPHGEDPGCLIVGECTAEQLAKAQKMWAQISYAGMGVGLVGLALHLIGLPVRIPETVDRKRFISSRLLTGSLTSLIFCVVAYTAITRATSASDIFTRAATAASGLALAWLLAQTAGYRTARPRSTMLVGYVGGLGAIVASSWLLFNTELLPLLTQFGGETIVTMYMAVFALLTVVLLIPVMITMALLSRPWRIESDPTETITLPPELMEELAEKAKEEPASSRTASWVPGGRQSEAAKTAVQPAASVDVDRAPAARRSATEPPREDTAPRRGGAMEPDLEQVHPWSSRTSTSVAAASTSTEDPDATRLSWRQQRESATRASAGQPGPEYTRGEREEPQRRRQGWAPLEPRPEAAPEHSEQPTPQWRNRSDRFDEPSGPPRRGNEIPEEDRRSQTARSGRWPDESSRREERREEPWPGRESPRSESAERSWPYPGEAEERRGSYPAERSDYRDADRGRTHSDRRRPWESEDDVAPPGRDRDGHWGRSEPGRGESYRSEPEHQPSPPPRRGRRGMPPRD